MNVIIEDWKDFRDLCLSLKAPCATLYYDSDKYFQSLWQEYQESYVNICQIQDMINNAWQYQVYGSIEDLIDHSVFDEWKDKKDFCLWACVTFPEVDDYCNKEYRKQLDIKGDTFDFNDILNDEIYETIVNSFDNLDFVTPLQNLCNKYRYGYVFNDTDNILIIK